MRSKPKFLFSYTPQTLRFSGWFGFTSVYSSLLILYWKFARKPILHLTLLAHVCVSANYQTGGGLHQEAAERLQGLPRPCAVPKGVSRPQPWEGDAGEQAARGRPQAWYFGAWYAKSKILRKPSSCAILHKPSWTNMSSVVSLQTGPFCRRFVCSLKPATLLPSWNKRVLATTARFTSTWFHINKLFHLLFHINKLFHFEIVSYQ